MRFSIREFKYGVLLFRILAAAFLLSLVLAIAATMSIDAPQRDITPPIHQVEIETREQAAKSNSYPAPFCFPFRERPTSMSSLTPFTQEFGHLVRHNSQGFRTPEYTIAHPPDTFRILVIGDSLTYGKGVPVEETYSYVLSNLLNQQCARFKSEVISLGVPGHRLADDLIKLMVHGQSLKPDLVIFQINPNDLDFYSYGFIYYMHGVTDQSSTYLAKEREVYSENSLDWKVFLETLQEIRKWSQTTSVPVAFLAFPLIDSGRTGRNFNHYQLSSLSSNPQFTDFGRVLDTIRKYGMPVLYMLETFRTQAGDRPLTVSQWVGDLNTYGHRLVAETLLSFLFQEKLVDCSQSEIQPEDPHWKQESVLRTEAKEKWFEFNINYVKQLQFYEELRKLYPRDPWIVDQCGRIYFATKRWWDSYKTYSSLTNLAPTFTSPWYYMALSSNEQERIGQLENMLRVVPDDTITMQVLSGLYFGTQRKVEACRLLSRIMEIPRFVQQYEGSKEQYEKQKCREVLSR